MSYKKHVIIVGTGFGGLLAIKKLSKDKEIRVDTRGDHRIAMLGAVAGLSSREGVRIEGADAVDVSFPGFYEVVDQLRHSPRGRREWTEP